MKILFEIFDDPHANLEELCWNNLVLQFNLHFITSFLLEEFTIFVINNHNFLMRCIF